MLWSTQGLSTFMSTQRISRHVDIIFNISTKEQWKNKMSIIMWEAAMSYASTFKQKNEISLGPKRCNITNWEPYFLVNFQITLVSQRHSSVLVNKNCAFYVNELSIGPYMMCYIQRKYLQLLASPLTKWNLPIPCNIGRETRCVFQNWNGIFPTSELSFTRGFMNKLMTDWWRIIIKNILPLPECILDYFFKLTLNHQGPYV